MTYRRLTLGLVALILTTTAWANSDQLLARLQPQGAINDFAGVLPAQSAEALRSFLADLERQTSVEVFVVTVSSLEGGDVDDFTNRLFNKWGVGKKGKNNGVLILAAIQDRKGRIEVGYGLESVIPDAIAGRILREEMFPPFKQGRYADGLTAAAHRIASLAGGGQMPAPQPASQSGSSSPAAVGLFLAVFAFIGGLMLGGGIRTRQVGLISFAPVFVIGAVGDPDGTLDLTVGASRWRAPMRDLAATYHDAIPRSMSKVAIASDDVVATGTGGS